MEDSLKVLYSFYFPRLIGKRSRIDLIDFHVLSSRFLEGYDLQRIVCFEDIKEFDNFFHLEHVKIILLLTNLTNKEDYGLKFQLVIEERDMVLPWINLLSMIKKDEDKFESFKHFIKLVKITKI